MRARAESDTLNWTMMSTSHGGTRSTSIGTGASSPPSSPGRFEASGVSDRGRTRPSNEDCFRIDLGLGLLLVADGMGGHQGGEVASATAADAVVECLTHPLSGADRWPYGYDSSLSENGNRLRTAVHAAHLRVLETSLTDSSLAGMGTTIVAAIERQGCLSVAWVGDSRLYLLDGDRAQRLTRDDSWLEAALAENPLADEDVLRRHPLRNALTNVLGTTSRTDVHVIEVPVGAGTVIALTTDGVHGTLDDRHMGQVLSQGATPAQAAADLVAAALTGGSTDNCTAVVARCTV